MKLKASTTMGGPINWVQVEKRALEQLGELMGRNPKAAQLMLALMRQMEPGSGGVVVASRVAMQELMGVSMPTVERALRVLITEGWVQRLKIGGASALAINTRIAWVGPRGDMQHAVFQATVIASRAEQDQLALDPPDMKRVPSVATGEQMVVQGDGMAPPVQTVLEDPSLLPDPLGGQRREQGLPQALRNAPRRQPSEGQQTIPWSGEPLEE